MLLCERVYFIHKWIRVVWVVWYDWREGGVEVYGCGWVIFDCVIAMTYYHRVGRRNRLIRPHHSHLNRWLGACFSAFDIAIGIGGGDPLWCDFWHGRRSGP